jgi:hypothetical protein
MPENKAPPVLRVKLGQPVSRVPWENKVLLVPMVRKVSPATRDRSATKDRPEIRVR